MNTLVPCNGRRIEKRGIDKNGQAGASNGKAKLPFALLSESHAQISFSGRVIEDTSLDFLA